MKATRAPNETVNDSPMGKSRQSEAPPVTSRKRSGIPGVTPGSVSVAAPPPTERSSPQARSCPRSSRTDISAPANTAGGKRPLRAAESKKNCPPPEPRIGDLDRRVGEAEAAHQQGLAVALLHYIVARREREAALIPTRLRYLRHRPARSVEHHVHAFGPRREDQGAPRRSQLCEHHVPRSAQIVEVNGMLRARARLRGLADRAGVGVRVR